MDRETRELIKDQPPELMKEAASLLERQVSPEFLRSQIEIGTKSVRRCPRSVGDLTRLRSVVAEAAANHGLAPIAASTHPFAQMAGAASHRRRRYRELAADMQTVMRRLMICGMHVHVGIEDPDLRIDLMGQAAYFMPHILALSTSSPFWSGMETGLKSYRKTVFKAAPRTGLPEHFASWGEYERHVAVLVDAGIIADASMIWWDLRPSIRYPTWEMRVADLPTRMEDQLCLAAIYVCILRSCGGVASRTSGGAPMPTSSSRRTCGGLSGMA